MCRQPKYLETAVSVLSGWEIREMVAIVAGNGLGLFNASLNSLGGSGAGGQSNLGQAGGKALVNVSNGNLVLRFTDEQMSGLGQDLLHTRTYNTQGALNDADADGWRWDGERSLALIGNLNTASSRLVRTTGDGHQTTYRWDGTRYQSSEGTHDTANWDSDNNQWIWTEGSSRTVERYSGSTGKLTSVTDANGTRINYGYDAQGRLNSVKDSSGQELVLNYTVAGKLERLDTRNTTGGGLTRQIYYGYDALGRLTSVSTDLSPDDNSIADGKVYTTEYSYLGNTFYIAGVTQSDGTSVSFGYVQVGAEYRISTVTDASGFTRFSYDTVNRRTDVLNGLGQQWSYFYDAQDRLIEVQTPAVNGQRLSTRYAYDTDGNVIKVTDGRGNSVGYHYDANGNRVLERDSAGTTIARTYNADNQLLNEIRYSTAAVINASTGTWTEPPASSAQVTRYTYDSNDRLRFRIDARGQVTEHRFNAEGLPSQEITYGDALFNLGGLSLNASVSEATLIAWTSARDKTRSSLTELSYDYRGNMSRRVIYGAVNTAGVGMLDSSASAHEYIYSPHGQLLQTLVVRGAVRDQKIIQSSVVYDGLGRVLSQTDKSGTRTTVYNGQSRTVSTTNSAGMTLSQSYDSAGRLVSQSETAANATPRSTLFVYDAAGRQTMTQDATGVRSYVLYDEAGRVSAQIDGVGAVTENIYNEAGQRIEEKCYATLIDTRSVYDGTKVLITLVSQIRPAVGTNDRASRFTYDAAGRLSTSTDPAGLVTTRTYDGLGQLLQQQSADRLTRFFYDTSGHVTGQLDAEGYLRENRYDAGGRLTQTIRYATASTLANRNTGTLDQLRPSETGSLSNWYYYDAAGRLIGSVDEQQFVSETRYDDAANTQQSIRYGTAYTTAISSGTSLASIKAAVTTSTVKQTTTTAFDNQSRIARITTTDGTVTSYEYDTSGRLISENRAQVTVDERSVVTRYDAFGQMIGKLQLDKGTSSLLAGMNAEQLANAYGAYGLTYRYDAAGRVASVSNGLGNRTASYYDAAGRLTHVINALGEVSETVYNAFGDISERTNLTARLKAGDTVALTGGLITQPVKTLVQAIRNATTDNRQNYSFDTRGLLISSTNALGFLTNYGYNSFGEQNSVTRTIASGVTVTDILRYSNRGEAIGSTKDVGGLARNTTMVYDAFGRVVSSTDGRGLVSTTAYTNNGRTITARNALGQSQSTTYDAFGRVLTSTDALGKVTTYSYNDSTRTLTVTTPDGVSVKTVKNRNGQTLSVTDGAGSISTYTYDRTNQLLTSTDNLGRTTTHAYDLAGHLISVTDALGRETRYGYDAVNRVITRTDANNVITRYTFDGQGRQVRVTEAEGLSEQCFTDYAFDRNGQVLSVTQDPNGLKLTTTYTYDGLGKQVQVTRGTTANPNQQIILYGYDKLGRRISERLDPIGVNQTTQYRYNANDQVTRKIDPAGVSTWYIYDNAGRLTNTVDALGGVTRNVYNNNGNLISTTRFATEIASNVVANLGDAPSSVTPTTSTAADQTTRYVYDDQGRVRYNMDAKGGVTETTYNTTGNIAQSIRYSKAIPITTPGTLADTSAALLTAAAQPLATRYVYDGIGQLMSMTDAAGKTESYTYDAVGNRKTLTNKNRAVWNYNYDKLNRLTEEISPAISVSSIATNGAVTSQTALQVTSITYDALGNVTSRTAGRLRNTLTTNPTSDDLSQARTTGYGYDTVGNQTRITSPGWYNKATGTYQTSPDGTPNTFQITTEVTYDPLGNAVRNRVRINNTGVAASDYVDSYKVYDLLGRLTHDIDALKGVTAYTYDAQGNTLTTKRHANALTAAVPAIGYYQPGTISVTTLIANPAQDRTLTTTYDVLGRKTAVQQDQIGLYTFTGSVAVSTLITAAPTTLYTYNTLGQVIRQTQIARNTSGTTVLNGASSYYYYDLNGNQVGNVDALGNYTRMEYDALGKLTRQVDYANALSTWGETVLPANPLANVIDRSTRFEYDAMGRLNQATQESVRYWQQSINASNGAVSANAIVGNQIVNRMTYDGTGNILTQTDAAGNVTTTEYNALGQVRKITEPARTSARAGTADPFAAGTLVASPTTTYAVNAFGQVISETRGAGRDANNILQAGLTQITRTRFDAAGYEIHGIDAAGVTTNYKIDVAGRRTEQSLQTKVVLSGWTVAGASLSRTQTIRRSFAYDALGQQLSTTDWYTAADNTQKSTTNSALYNRFGEVTTQLLNGYTQVSYLYDQGGRSSQQQNGQGITRIDYGLTGKASRSNQIGDATAAADDRITYTKYDILGRALEQHLPAFEANINADTLNSVNLTLTTPILRQTYDRWGNVLSRTDARGYVTTYSYDHNNKQLTETLPVTDILRENGTSYRASLIHEKRYDVLGQLIQETDLVGPYAGVTTSTELRTRQHVFNQAGELTQDIDAQGYARSYLTDSNGNRTAIRDALGTVLVDTYDVMDRQLTHGIVRNGQVVTLLSNLYDQAGRLVGEISGSAAIEETLASAAGSGVTTGVAGNVRYTLFDERGNIVKTRNESKVEKGYDYSEQNRKIKETDGLNNTLTWTHSEENYGQLTGHKDLLGRVFSYNYNSFGQLTSEAGTDYLIFPGSPTIGGFSHQLLYTYYTNGLIKDSTYTNYFTASDVPDTLTSSHQYNLSSNKVRELTSSKISHPFWAFMRLEGAFETRYSFDESSRLAGARIPTGGYAARLDSLKYSYDELGNRRRAYLDTTNQSGGRTVIDDWYKYDQEDRALIDSGFLNNGQIVAGKINNKAKGTAITYDANGQRKTLEQWDKTSESTELYQLYEYSYNDTGHVTSSSGRQFVRSIGADNAQTVQSTSGPTLKFVKTYDVRGYQISQTDYTTSAASGNTAYSYRGDGQLINQTSYIVNGGAQRLAQQNYFGETGMLDAAGNQRVYRYVIYNPDGVSVKFINSYSKVYSLYDDYKEGANTVVSTQASTPGTTTFYYTGKGALMAVASPNNEFSTFATNTDGQLVTRRGFNGTTQNYLYYQGAALANVGNTSAPEITNTLTPISSDYPSRTPSSYIVNQADTLARVAQAVWGDSAMWYLIADANGLSANQVLTPGSTLIIPNVVSSTHNNATTFKPYSADDVIGDTTPSPQPPPPPPKPKKKKCNGVASVVMVVVAVVATVFTAGAALTVLAPAMATGLSAFGAGLAALGGAAGWAGLGAAVVGGMAGSAASQLAGKSMGVVDKFSWGQVAAGGLGAGLTFGFGSLAQTGSLGTWGNTAAQGMKTGGAFGTGYAAQGVFNYASSQVASRIVGLDTTFSWRNVAASAAGATVGGAMGTGTSITSSIIRGQVSAFASAGIKDKWLGGGRPDYGQVAADAFGNVLGDYMVSQIEKSSTPPEKLNASLATNQFERMLNSSERENLTTEELAYLSRTADRNGGVLPDALHRAVFGDQRPLFSASVYDDTDLMTTYPTYFDTGNSLLDMTYGLNSAIHNGVALGVNGLWAAANVAPIAWAEFSGRSFDQASTDIMVLSAQSFGPLGGLVGELGTLSARIEGLTARGTTLERYSYKIEDDVPLNILLDTARQALLRQASSTNSLSEAKGIVYATHEMRRLGYTLEDVSLHYRGNQGIDLVFSQGEKFAIVEAKAGRYLSNLKTDKSGMRQGSLDFNASRLERYIAYGDGKHNEFSNKLLDDAFNGKLESFTSLYKGRTTYELPIGWPSPYAPAQKR